MKMDPNAHYDCHTHFIPDHFPAYLGKSADTPWPSMRRCGCGHGEVILSGKVFRKVPNSSWDANSRLYDMAASEIDVQVVSPMPELLSYWLAPEDAFSLCSFLNGEMAELVASAPKSFMALGAVVLQDVSMSCRMLEDMMRTGHFRGVEVGTNVNGVPIGDPRFNEFFETAERLGAAVFVHALKPVGDERIPGMPGLRPIVSFPCEVSYAIVSVLASGLMTRCPKLKIAFSHGGGAFGLILPRLQHAWQSTESTRAMIKEDPRQTASKLYYDTLVYQPQTLAFLIEQFGASQFIAGSDYPFAIAEKYPVAFVRGAAPSQAAQEILQKNAERFLGLDLVSESP